MVPILASTPYYVRHTMYIDELGERGIMTLRCNVMSYLIM
jgi:hypothetical protein